MEPTDWLHWELWFDAEAQKLGKKYPEWIDLTAPGDLADQFVEMTRSTEAQLDELLADFAYGEPLPEMNRLLGTMARLRFWEAARWAGVLQFLQASKLFASATSTPAPAPLKAWFLVEAWHGVLFEQIHGRLEDRRRRDWIGSNPGIPGSDAFLN